MAKKASKSHDSNQLHLFAETSPIQPTTAARSYLHLERLEKEDKHIRGGFTSKEEYYLSPQWRSKRLQKLRLVGYKCESCRRAGNLDMHHIHYDNLYDERMEDLQALCRSCHDIADGNREYDSAYTSYLRTKYGEGEAWKYESEHEEEQFREWRERKENEW